MYRQAEMQLDRDALKGTRAAAYRQPRRRAGGGSFPARCESLPRRWTIAATPGTHYSDDPKQPTVRSQAFKSELGDNGSIGASGGWRKHRIVRSIFSFAFSPRIRLRRSRRKTKRRSPVSDSSQVIVNTRRIPADVGLSNAATWRFSTHCTAAGVDSLRFTLRCRSHSLCLPAGTAVIGNAESTSKGPADEPSISHVSAESMRSSSRHPIKCSSRANWLQMSAQRLGSQVQSRFRKVA